MNFTKKGMLFSLFFPLAFALSGQITITGAQLPQAGDTLYFATDNIPASIDPGLPLPDQRWDFTTLQAPFTNRVIWRAADQGLAGNRFPEADLVAQIAENIEGYYQIDRSSLYLVGTYGADPLGILSGFVVRNTPPLTELHTPLRYGDQTAVETQSSYAFATENLPDTLRSLLPITPDSIRIRQTLSREAEVDAWGKLIIPGGIFDVLRERRVDYRQVRLDAKIGRLPWQDITDLIPGFDRLGAFADVSYRFLSPETKEPVAELKMAPGESRVRQVVFKAIDITTNVQNLDNLTPGVYAFPNPAIVNVRFEFANLPPGTYNLSIMNILGIEVWKQRYDINGDHTEKVDISSLRKGTYLYSLKDNNGKIITTKRLVVVRP